MTIGGIDGNKNMGTGAISMGNPNMDSYSKRLQRQISEAEKQLQELAKDTEMDPDTKMKKRQEIQKQISDLNMQLRQHQIEERQKAQQQKQQQGRQKNQSRESEEKASGLSKNNMEAMISAESSMKLAKVQGSTANQMENEANIKRTEIKLDGGGSARTSNDSAAVSKKWDDVEGMEQKARAAADSQASLLAETQSKLSQANAEGATSAKAEEKSDEEAETEGKEAASAAASASAKRPAEIGSNVDIKL